MKQLKTRSYTLVFCLLLVAQASAQTLSGTDLVSALQQGGYVLVMRHADSPRQAPDAASANPDNVNRERQLDEKGRRDARAMGAALQRLAIPVSEVLSSPTYRALETARMAGYTDIAEHEELSNEGMSAAGAANTAWLHAQVAEAPAPGNRLLITHGPNINAAFPEHAAGMEEGEALVLDPQGVAGPVLVAKIKIGEWPTL